MMTLLFALQIHSQQQQIPNATLEIKFFSVYLQTIWEVNCPIASEPLKLGVCV